MGSTRAMIQVSFSIVSVFLAVLNETQNLLNRSHRNFISSIHYELLVFALMDCEYFLMNLLLVFLKQIKNILIINLNVGQLDIELHFFSLELIYFVE